MRYLLSILLLSAQLLFAQEYQSTDLIGEWEVNRCELYSNKEPIKTAYLDNSAIGGKVIEGKYAGKLDEDIESTIKSILGTVISFSEDSTVSWNGEVNGLAFKNEYWQLNSTGELLICHYENRFSLKPLLFIGRIVIINHGELRVTYFDSGFEVRLVFIKQ